MKAFYNLILGILYLSFWLHSVDMYHKGNINFRLGLERGKTAKEALDILTNHVEKYGQGGRMCESEPDDSYDSGFIIADRTEAWLLETSDIHWAAKSVKGSILISTVCLFCL